MTNPLISVIVPVYNVEKYLPRCVDSIINQDYKNIEIILVDDGSPDNSPKICDEYAKKDNRIKVIHKENGGVAEARNAGILIAKGEYISFVDSDDWVDSDFFVTLYQGIEKGADIAECATKLVDDQGNTLSTRGLQEGMLTRNDALKHLVSEKGIYTTIWNRLYKKSVIENILFPAGKFHEDDFWVWRVLKNTNKLYYCEKPMYNYLQRSDGFTGTKYTMRRLDGVQARYECMVGLSDIPEVAGLAKVSFANILIYNLQASLKYLDGTDKETAVKKIMQYKKDLKLTSEEYSLVKGKEKLWIRLFMFMPKITVGVRNIIGIGY